MVARIVSLVPAATEYVFALGLGDRLVGRSHGCDHPPEAARVPVVSRPAFDVSGSGAAIDAAVRSRLSGAEPVFEVDAGVLAELAPDLVLVAEGCRVCSADGKDVALPPGARLFPLRHARLRDVPGEARRVANACGVSARGRHVAHTIEARLHEVRIRAARTRDRPSLLVLDWLDPPMVAGHWIPDLVRLAGGEPVLTEPGDPSRRIAWSDAAAADPDLLLAAPCGFDLRRSFGELARVSADPASGLGNLAVSRLFVADGNAYFNRPGPRIADAASFVAWMLHPGEFPEPPPEAVEAIGL
ncbi:MAG: ABC transporter substrate-binding protein [Methanobacteriota archaeon]